MATNLFKERLLQEARDFAVYAEQLPRRVQAVLMESHRLPGEVMCQGCGELASYSRRNDEFRFEYFCSVHAPEDAVCFVVEEYRSQYK